MTTATWPVKSQLVRDQQLALRPLVREANPSDPARRNQLDGLVRREAQLAVASLDDRSSLDLATAGVDVIISALQGGAEVIADGQVALAEPGGANGVRRLAPCDFALTLWAAPAGTTTLAISREAAEQMARVGIEVVHALNGAFMDMLLARGHGAIYPDQS